MVAEQIPLIEAKTLPVEQRHIPPTDLYLVIAWVPFRSTIYPYELLPQVRSQVEAYTDREVAQRSAEQLSAHWTGRCIAHVVIGGE